MSAVTTSLTEDLQPSSSVLLLTEAQSQHDDDACMDLLSVTNPQQENVLSITVTQSANDRLKLWQKHIETLPAKATIISVGEITRSAAAGSTGSMQLSPGVRIETVKNPGDLTGLGITITEQLKEFMQDDNQVVVCFHSLTPLLQYAELTRVFRFLHVLIGRLNSMNAVTHFHMDPSAHDQQTINTLTQLFDAVIDRDRNDKWRIRSR